MKTTPFAVAFALCATVAAPPAARAFEAGWSSVEIAPAAAGAPPTTVALFYPTAAASARPIPMGPFTVTVAPRAAPTESVRGLIVLSHGTGGSELGHASLAQALARHGYLVAAVRHPGDHWQDRTLLAESSRRYFDERPRQASRVVDALLASPQWSARIARDADGPRVGAVGHSAGGYTVLALAGARPDVARIVEHCATERARDPIFCGMGGSPAGPTAPDAVAPARSARVADSASGAGAAKDVAADGRSANVAGPSPRDPRVRAVVALAPVGVVLDASSLASIAIPVAVYGAELDRFLVPEFHARRVAGLVPGVESHPVAGAGHFAFLDTPAWEIPSEDGDVRWNPPGFDRAAFLARLAAELPAFFDRVFERRGH